MGDPLPGAASLVREPGERAPASAHLNPGFHHVQHVDYPHLIARIDEVDFHQLHVLVGDGLPQPLDFDDQLTLPPGRPFARHNVRDRKGSEF